ncbi:MAG: IS6 family transposase [Alphaproteobacteria bacterium]|nr:MAG: IS6 family transposase [Alphaproteobacteria bacterium]
MSRKSRAKPPSPFLRFNSSPEVIRLVVLMYVRFPLSLRNVEDLLFERGIDICHETVRLWWNRFGPLFAGDIRRQRVSRMRGFRQMKTLQKFASVHASVHNHFSLERHLTNRQTYRERRSAALAKWQALAS